MNQNKKKLVITLVVVGVVLLAVAGVLIVMRQTNPDGTVRVSAGDVTVEPVGELVMRKYQDGRVDDRWATEIEDLYPSMPVIVYDGNAPEPIYKGTQDSYEPLYLYFEYDGAEWVEYLNSEFLTVPEQPGTYVVRLDICWGDYFDFSQYWYYFVLEVPA